jgi:hypothetical protein
MRERGVVGGGGEEDGVGEIKIRWSHVSISK